MSLKYNIDYNNFTAEEMQNWARNMAEQQGKKYIEQDITKTQSIFKNTDEEQILLKKFSPEVEEENEDKKN